MSDESVAHALEGWRQAERDEKAVHEDDSSDHPSTSEQREASQERVVAARDAYEIAAERAQKRQEPDPEESSVAKLDQSAAESRP
jgi:hypothetical protein